MLIHPFLPSKQDHLHKATCRLSLTVPDKASNTTMNIRGLRTKLRLPMLRWRYISEYTTILMIRGGVNEFSYPTSIQDHQPYIATHSVNLGCPTLRPQTCVLKYISLNASQQGMVGETTLVQNYNLIYENEIL